ncbi:MAG: hypothetical protein KDB04_03570 [Acidimicrobiales bacterium]|nr:hypothetical protein [Acidimicrobiales bacterium]HRW36268.1 hypothetical protein [Aquihabitans sp.]
MAVPPPVELTFDEVDPSAVAGELERLAGTGAWVNLVPEVEPGHEPPPRSAVISLFSARGEAVPFATWSASGPGDRRHTLGIEHGSGPRALARLDEVDLGLRPRWFKVADHPRRGLVVTCPSDEPAEDVLWWLLAACHALSAVPLSGTWQARVYEPG